jgi:hypothetical protein
METSISGISNSTHYHPRYSAGYRQAYAVDFSHDTIAAVLPSALMHVAVQAKPKRTRFAGPSTLDAGLNCSETSPKAYQALYPTRSISRKSASEFSEKHRLGTMKNIPFSYLIRKLRDVSTKPFVADQEVLDVDKAVLQSNPAWSKVNTVGACFA